MSGSASHSNNSEGSVRQELTAKKKAEGERLDMFKRLSLEEGAVKAPPRKEPGTSGRQKGIDTNIFQVQLKEKYVYRYDVTVTGESRRGNKVDLTKRSESSVVIADRINNCRDAFRAIFSAYPEVFGTDQTKVYYDLQSILYTLYPLDIVQDRSIELVVTPENVPSMPPNLVQITMELKNVQERAGKINLADLASLINAETLKSDRSILTFIELAINQYGMFNEHQFLTLRGSTSFLLNGADHGLHDVVLDRNGLKYLSSGAQKSAALIEGHKSVHNIDPNERCVGVLLEAKRSPFHAAVPLLNCIQRHEATQQLYGGFLHGRIDEKILPGSINTLTKIFKKMRMEVHYPTGSRRKVQLWSFDKSTASTHYIDKLNISVAKYFANKYGSLKYPNAYLVAVKQGENMNFYPPELLHIADNQIVTAEQMDSASKSKMINTCAVRPDGLKRDNRSVAAAMHLHDSQYTQNADILFSKQTLQTKSRILDAPLIAYASANSSGINKQRVQRDEALWRINPYIRPADCKNYSIYVLAPVNNSNEDDEYPNKQQHTESPNMTQNDIAAFRHELEKFAQRMGIVLGECRDAGIYGSNEVEKCVQYCAENDIGLCLFISPGNMKGVHAVMKMCEHRYNVVTQDVKLATARKMITQGAAATVENYMAKTNIKCGGLNHSVEVDDPEVMEQLQNSMFVGINTNNPGSKTLVNRVAKTTVDSKPGVLGYSANMGVNYNEFLGDFYYTPSYRSEIYGELREIFKMCVARFKENRGYAPKNIFFYYLGLVEGQFENAQKYTIPLIKDGIREANGGNDIPLTLIALQKTNNIRLFPKEYPQSGKDHFYNVSHGTVVDTTIVHPVFTEFYLMSHTPSKGIGRVPRYSIVHDEGDFSLNVLEGVTHALSYEHQIVSKATRQPTPISVAMGYAQRGRDVFNAEFNDEDKKAELPRGADGGFDLRLLSEQLNYSHSQLANQRVNA